MDPLDAQFLAALNDDDPAEIERLGLLVDAAQEAKRLRLAAPGALRTAALWYAGRGWPCFPCLPREKRPATRHGLNDASIDKYRVWEWWTDQPDANIGLPTGLAFDVIDVDGAAGIESLHAEPPLNLPPTLGLVLTPRRPGMHRYVAATGLGNKAGLRPGIDYRGKGGYVVAPPSRTEYGTYSWVTPYAEAAA